MLCELPFYNELSIAKMLTFAFRGYARSYRIGIIGSNYDRSGELTISKLSIEDLFSDLLDEIKGFDYIKYQITRKV